MTSIAFTPNGAQLVSASRDRTIVIWDLATREKSMDLGRIPASIYDLAISKDPSPRLAAALANNEIWIWQLPEPKPIAKLKKHTRAVTRVAFIGVANNVLLLSSRLSYGLPFDTCRKSSASSTA